LVSEVRFEAPTWNQIYDMLLNLAERIRKDRFRPDIIVGISRGGWPPARILSDLLSNPNLANVRAEFYLGFSETKDEPSLTQPLSMDVFDKRILIVDEVADTGKSLRLVREHIVQQGARELKILTVYYKPWSAVKPDYYSKETNDWVVFPWEIKETIGKILRRSHERGQRIEVEAKKLVEAGVPAQLVERFVKEVTEESDC
jgi:hypoxanthine phosphoribosyltransferase